MARAIGVPYDVRKTFPYLGYETYDFEVPTETHGDVYDRYLVRVAEMRQSVKIASQALARITPRGVYDIQDYRIVPPPKDKVYTRDGSAHSALPDLFAGLHGAGRRVLRAGRGAARRARLLHRVGRIEPAVSDQAAGADASTRARRLPKMIEGGMIADVIAVIGSTDVVMGDVDR